MYFKKFFLLNFCLYKNTDGGIYFHGVHSQNWQKTKYKYE